MTSSVEQAIKNLSLPQYRGIRDVFEKVLTERSKQREPDCALLNLFAMKHYLMNDLNEDCEIFVREIGLADARRKCRDAMLGLVRRSAAEFNGVWSDFWAEMAAIRTLASEGYSQLRAIHSKQADGTTSDYQGFDPSGQPVWIEVKNMRSSRTILEVFSRSIGDLYASEPAHYPFRIQVEYAYDNRPTAGQERTIRDYVRSLRGRKPPFSDVRDLGEAVAKLTVTEGDGTAFMTRGIGPESPEPLNKR